MALDFSLGISWQFGSLAVLSLLAFPFVRGRFAFLIGALAYPLVDILPAAFGAQGTVGLWTLTGAITWGLVALFYSRQKPSGSPLNFAKLGIAGTLIFDAITGPLASTIIWGMPFSDSLIGQIPFTLKHLLGIAAVSLILAPLLFPSTSKLLSKRKWFVLKPAVMRS